MKILKNNSIIEIDIGDYDNLNNLIRNLSDIFTTKIFIGSFVPLDIADLVIKESNRIGLPIVYSQATKNSKLIISRPNQDQIESSLNILWGKDLPFSEDGFIIFTSLLGKESIKLIKAINNEKDFSDRIKNMNNLAILKNDSDGVMYSLRGTENYTEQFTDKFLNK